MGEDRPSKESRMMRAKAGLRSLAELDFRLLAGTHGAICTYSTIRPDPKRTSTMANHGIRPVRKCVIRVEARSKTTQSRLELRRRPTIILARQVKPAAVRLYEVEQGTTTAFSLPRLLLSELGDVP
jgi:hypothetical protein